MPRAWLQQLQSSMQQEYADRPRVMTLATVDGEGRPAARSVVCRKLTDDGLIVIASDARSRKGSQLLACNACELVVWLATLRRQFRIVGEAEVVTSATDPDRLALWQDLSDSARALFAWPAPGSTQTSTAPTDFPTTVSMGSPIPPHFEMLHIRPLQVELLDLNHHPHLRHRWRRDNDWRVEMLNP